jgi:PIN domain nuclease of toxin-antitoxin system
MTQSPFLFDSYALLLLLQKEKGFEKVVDLLEEIHQSGLPKYLNAINLGEIIYITKRECVFHAHPAGHSMVIRPPIPRSSGH